MQYSQLLENELLLPENLLILANDLCILGNELFVFMNVHGFLILSNHSSVFIYDFLLFINYDGASVNSRKKIFKFIFSTVFLPKQQKKYI